MHHTTSTSSSVRPVVAGEEGSVGGLTWAACNIRVTEREQGQDVHWWWPRRCIVVVKTTKAVHSLQYVGCMLSVTVYAQRVFVATPENIPASGRRHKRTPAPTVASSKALAPYPRHTMHALPPSPSPPNATHTNKRTKANVAQQHHHIQPNSLNHAALFDPQQWPDPGEDSGGQLGQQRGQKGRETAKADVCVAITTHACLADSCSSSSCSCGGGSGILGQRPRSVCRAVLLSSQGCCSWCCCC